MSEILDHLAADQIHPTDLAADQAPAEHAAAAQPERRTKPQLSVIIPTRNEAPNIGPLVEAISDALSELDAELIFVDDSDDDTPDRIRDTATVQAEPTLAIRLIERRGDARVGGLSGAVLDGLAAAKSRWVCVMDGDLQHPPSVIRQMFRIADRGDADLVVASRHQPNGSSDGLSSDTRKALSRLSSRAARLVFPTRLDAVSDPMSGFFMVDRTQLDLTRLRPRGFKILLELIVSHPDLRVAEVPFVFAPRHAGDSKADVRQGVEFGKQLLALRFQGRRTAYCYDIHGILSVESQRALPELEKFLVPSLAAPASISVTVESPDGLPLGESVDLTDGAPKVSYRERAGFAMSLQVAPSRVDITVSPFVARSPHVMYTNVVEPVLRWRLAELGYALVHAACFSDGDRGFLVTARTDTGKTTTMLKVLDDTPFQFISDDLVIVSPDGVIRSFPKPLTISAHTVHALKNTTLSRSERIALVPQSRIHSREGRRFAFLLTKYRLPVASINALIQILVPPPKYHVGRLVRGVEVATDAGITGMFIIQRGGSGDEPLEADEALSTLLSNCDDAFGFPPYDSLERLMLSIADDDLRAVERDIISSALENVPTRLMRSDHLDWAERIRSLVVDWQPPRAATTVDA